jgi:hypothetical protein
MEGRKRIVINLGGQFATLGGNVITIKYCCFDEIHTVQIKVNPKPNFVFLNFYFISSVLFF